MLCAASSHNVGKAFQSMISRVELTVSILSVMADTLDDDLLQMEVQMRSLRSLLSDEAVLEATTRNAILGVPLHRLGWNSQRLRHFNTRMHAIGMAKSFRNTASAYVRSVRSRLWSARKALEALQGLSDESHDSDTLPM